MTLWCFQECDCKKLAENNAKIFLFRRSKNVDGCGREKNSSRQQKSAWKFPKALPLPA
jgi:hypothetical protein